MALSDVEIRAEIVAKRLIIEPPVVNTDRIGSSSIDLLLHEDLVVLPERVPGVTVDPSDTDIDVMSILESQGEAKSLQHGAHHIMEPRRLIIGKTLETIKLPLHLAARIEGKSSLARLGLSVHVTAPTVMAGFEGRLYLEMNNIGPFTILLRARMQIAQLILEHVGLPASERYSGRFQSQE